MVRDFIAALAYRVWARLVRSERTSAIIEHSGNEKLYTFEEVVGRKQSR